MCLRGSRILENFVAGGVFVKKIKCDLCGSSDFTKSGDGLFVCDFCRTKYTPDQAQKMMVEGSVTIDRSGEATRLVHLAKESLEHQNAKEAYDYASRALEINPESYEAWSCKASAAGWSSTLMDFRVGEITGGFANAEEYCPEDSKPALIEYSASQMKLIAMAMHRTSYSHAAEFRTLPGPWNEHVARCESVFMLLELSHELNPNDRDPLDNIIDICQKLLRGLDFTDYSGQISFTNRRHVSSEYASVLSNVILKATEKLKEFDPEYEVPSVNKASSGCFVVTATMGNEDAHAVRVLRIFRDNILTQSKPGRSFIAWYYLRGPKFAAFIADSRPLRMISYFSIVAPATAFASLALAARRFLDSK